MASTIPAKYSSLQFFLLTFPHPFVAHVEINRPQKLNAFTEPMWQEMGSLFRALSHDPEVRAVVLSGAGERAFTAGLDLQAASEGGIIGDSAGDVDVARRSAGIRRYVDGFQRDIGEIEACEKPVIVVLHGISLGLAIDISCCADIRLCAANTRFGVKEVDIGLAADIGTLARLPKVVGSMSWVKEVCLTARDFDAAEAANIGFVSKVYGTKEEAVGAGIALAEKLSRKSPVAVQGTKEILNHARDHSVADNLRYTRVWNSAALQSDDVKAALLSGIKKKTPRFEKL